MLKGKREMPSKKKEKEKLRALVFPVLIFLLVAARSDMM